MKPNEITQQIIDAAYKLHVALGPGLLESVYEITLCHELRKRGLRVQRQAPIAIEYDGVKFEEGYIADLLVEDSIIVELKSTEQNHPVHAKQLRTYLVLGKRQLGLVLNFGMEKLKEGITRIVNGLPEQSPAVPSQPFNPVLIISPRPLRSPRETGLQSGWKAVCGFL
jgi:GxxExxY protein